MTSSISHILLVDKYFLACTMGNGRLTIGPAAYKNFFIFLGHGNPVMKRPLVLFVFVLVAVIVILTWRLSRSHPQDTSAVESDPFTIIREFTRQPMLELEETDSVGSPPGRTFVTPGREALFIVDVQAGQVVYARLPHEPEISTNIVSRDDAYASARAFLSERLVGFEQMVLIDDELLDHHAGGIEYQFQWAELLGTRHAVGLQQVSVSVGAVSGEVIGFFRMLPVPITVAVEPTISREEALSIAEQGFGARVVESSIKFDVWWKDNDRQQPQVLRWTVELTSDESISPDVDIPKQAIYIIDAHTGEVLEELH